VTEQEWSACPSPTVLVEFLRNKASARKLRLVAVACSMRVWDSLYDVERDAVALIEKHVEGLASEEDRATAFKSTVGRVRAVYGHDERAVALDLLDRDGRFGAEAVMLLLPSDPVASQIEQETWCGIIRDIFGPLPFRPTPADAPRWLAWNDGALPKMARAIYDGRRFRDLPLVADALEEAGCDDADILAHCRACGEHVRGCWVLDLLLDKE
jgi:hypothetical protein